MNVEFYQGVVDLFNRFVNELDEKMYYAMQKKGDVCLQAPQFLIELLNKSLIITYNSSSITENTNGHFIFQGLKVEPTYEMAIILFHNQYPLYRHSWMLKKIPLDPPVNLKSEWYTTTIVKIKEQYSCFTNNHTEN